MKVSDVEANDPRRAELDRHMRELTERVRLREQVPSGMNDIEYTAAALRTADPTRGRTRDMVITGDEIEMLLGGIGIADEAGEVAGLIKKVVFHRHPLDKAKLVKELGDVLWYLNYLAVRVCGVSLGEIKSANIEKLRARYSNGFSSEESINRKPGDE